MHRRGGFVRHQWTKKASTQVSVCGKLGLALRLNLESTRLNVTRLTLHSNYQLSELQRCGPWEQCLYARFSRSRDLPRAKDVPSIQRCTDGWIARRDGCCHLPRAFSVVAERRRDANGRMVCFYLDCETSGLIESQPYTCHTIAGSLGTVMRSNKATWVRTVQCSVACCQEDGGHRLRCNQDDELQPSRARRISRAKANGEEIGIEDIDR